MDQYDISYTRAKQLICQHQIKRYMKEKQVSYEIACVADDIYVLVKRKLEYNN